MKKLLILLFVFINLICAQLYAKAQPDKDIGTYLLDANDQFKEGNYTGALINYQEVLRLQPTNYFAVSQVAKAKEELLYLDIIDGKNFEKDSRLYIEIYGSEGKYINTVKSGLGKNFINRAFQKYKDRDPEALEEIYVEYLFLLGSENSEEMKSWLYILCNEAGQNFLENKDWKRAKLYFEKSVKYAGSNSEFRKSQEGIEMAKKKKN